MTWTPLQETFVSGEITPALSSQISAEIYRSGLRTCRNMLPTHTGAVTTRPGLEHIEVIRENYAGEARVIPVDFGIEQRVILVLTDLELKVYSDGNFQQFGSLIQNQSFRDQGQHWTDIHRGEIQYENTTFPQFAGPGDDHWCKVEWLYSTVGRIYQDITITEDISGLNLEVVVFNNNSINGDVDIELTQMDTNTQIINEIVTLTPYETLHFIRPLSAIDSAWRGPLRVAITNETFAASLHVNSVSIPFEKAALPSLPPIASPYTSDQVEAIQYVQNPYNNAVVFVHPDVTPWELTRDFTTGAFTFQAITWDTGGQGTNPHWVTSPSAETGYPRAVGSSTGRCVFGGSYLEPQAIWSTAPGASGWHNVILPNDPVASSPLWYTMTALGYVQWVMGGPTALHGTSNGEHTVSALSALAESSDLQVIEQSTNGSAHIQAERVGHEVFYTGANRDDVRTMTYSHEVEVFRSDTMTLTAPHITRGKVKRLAYGRQPFKIVWCCLRDGTLAALSYDPGEKLKGWHRHDTNGTILDTAEGRLDGVDRIYSVVRRASSTSASTLTLEGMRAYENDKVVAMDRYTQADMNPPSDTITGLERFPDGTGLWVHTTSNLYGPLEVTSGTVTLPEAISGAYLVGEAFHQVIETMPALPTPVGGGNVGTAKTYSRIGLRLYESSLPIVNGVQYKQKLDKTASTGWGNYASGVLADYHQQHLGWDYLEPIRVEQTAPEKLTVTGIFGKLTDEDI